MEKDNNIHSDDMPMFIDSSVPVKDIILNGISITEKLNNLEKRLEAIENKDN